LQETTRFAFLHCVICGLCKVKVSFQEYALAFGFLHEERLRPIEPPTIIWNALKEIVGQNIRSRFRLPTKYM